MGPCHNCKKRNESYILDRYYQHCNVSGSNLTRVPLPDSHLSSPPAHVLTTNTEYGSLWYDSQCFSQNAAPRCTWSQNIKDLGEDVFPRFAVNVACSGCRYTNLTCNCHVLKLPLRLVFWSDKGSVIQVDLTHGNQWRRYWWLGVAATAGHSYTYILNTKFLLYKEKCFSFFCSRNV